MPAFASSSFAVDQELSKTGTIYETVSFTSLSTSQMDSNREFKAMQSELPEFKEIEFDRDTSSANYKMETATNPLTFIFYLPVNNVEIISSHLTA